MSRAELRQMIIDDIKQHRPEDAHIADQIVDHLLAMPILQSDDNVAQFIDKYRQAVKERDGNVSLRGEMNGLLG